MPPQLRDQAQASFYRDSFYLKQRLLPFIHTNACGDFTLLSKQDWFQLKGYPEWPLYSWHIDSVLVHQAYYQGLKMMNLDPSYCIYHIEHGHGSGWTPEGATTLFSRLDKKGIQYLDDNDLAHLQFLQYQDKEQGIKTTYNDESWGAADYNLSEEGG